MEFKRKQNVLRQKFWFRVSVCILSILFSISYIVCSGKSVVWGVIIGICGSALVWSLVELVDFFINTFYQYESERNTFLGLVFEYFSKMKQIIRSNKDDISMHEIKTNVDELYNEMNNFIFSSNVYPISKEFDKCSNYIERMYWKFDACCTGLYDDCEEKTEYYKKLYDSIIVFEEEKEKTSKRFFDGMRIEKTLSEMTDIELSFDKYKLPENMVDENVIGNISDSFSIPGNIRTTMTFKPDIDFYDLSRKNKFNAFRTVLCMLFRKVRIT